MALGLCFNKEEVGAQAYYNVTTHVRGMYTTTLGLCYFRLSPASVLIISFNCPPTPLNGNGKEDAPVPGERDSPILSSLSGEAGGVWPTRSRVQKALSFFYSHLPPQLHVRYIK